MLKRRAGTNHANDPTDFDLSANNDYVRARKEEENAAEVRRIYEQTKAESSRPSKRQKASPETIEEVEELAPAAHTRSHNHSDATASAQPNEPPAPLAMIIDDDGDEEDPVQQTLRRGREAKRSGAKRVAVPVPAQQPPNRSARSPSEEPEQVEVSARASTSRSALPTESTAPISVSEPSGPSVASGQASGSRHVPLRASQVDRDETFLRAITKASKKSGMEELDKEFDQLRIPKSRGQPVQNQWQMHPDWNLVTEFEDDLRGNFIQIIRKDLFRKDEGRPDAARVDDGKPNFKKFRKVRYHLDLMGSRSERHHPT